MRKTCSTSKPGAIRHFSFGDLVVAVSNARNKRKARAMLRFAVNSGLVTFPGSPQFLIS